MPDPPSGQAILGVPILYPTPDRVRNAAFCFDGQTYTFPNNVGTAHIHGLVQNVAWTYDAPVITDQSISVTTRLSFEPPKEYYRRFPIRNILELTYTLGREGVRMDFTVQNRDEEKRLAFGLGIHPYFRLPAKRGSVRLQVPAETWQEVDRDTLLPTGRLLDVADGPIDLRAPVSLDGLDLDDVFRITPGQPQVIYMDDAKTKLSLTGSVFFAYGVVYCPQAAPYFCVELQSCSTDAHNVYAQGRQDLANLQILDPGKSRQAWIEFTVSDQ